MLVISITVASSGCSVFADTKAGGTADLSGEMAEANEPDETDASANETGDISTTGADASAATTGADASTDAEASGSGKSGSISATAGVQNLARSALDAETQQTYDEILAACLQYKESVSLTTTNEDLLAPAYQAITSDHGELFWVSGYNYTLKTKGDQVTDITFSPKYMFSKEDKELYQGYVDQTVDEYFAKLPDGASDYEKSKYVYEMLVYNVKYNLSAKENQNILSVFLFGESVCNGIASAAQYMLSLLDLPSMIVYGASENEPHAWNLVYLDGAPYFFDATWGITSSETVGDCSYAFLNITSRDIEKTHSIDMYINVPECTEVSDNYYVKEGHFFTTFNEASIGDILADSYANGKPGDIKCATDEVYAQVKQEFVDNQKLADYCRGISSINYVEREEMRTITFMWK